MAAVVEDEPIFMIKDFTCASSFEELVHEFSRALKRWAADLHVSSKYTLHPERSDSFMHEGRRFELRCGHHPPTPSSSSSPPSAKFQRQGVFADRKAQQLEKLFGVRHTAVLSLGAARSAPGADSRRLDPDDARKMLSALVMATIGQQELLAGAAAEPLSCFVALDAGRLEGERRIGSCRTVFSADRADFVAPEFAEGPRALTAFFREKFGLGPREPVALAVRANYSAGSLLGRPVGQRQASATAEEEKPQLRGCSDPVESLQLQGEGVDLPPQRAALSWRLRVLLGNSTSVSSSSRFTGRLRRLRSFQVAAAEVRCVDQWRSLSETASAEPLGGGASLTNREAYLERLAGEIMETPVAPSIAEDAASSEQAILPTPSCSSSCSSPSSSRFPRAAPRGSLLRRFAEASSELPDLRSALQLWALLLQRFRGLMDAAGDFETATVCAEASVAARPAASSHEKRSPCGLRAVRVGLGRCPLQQRLELLKACLDARESTSSQRSEKTSLLCRRTGAPLVAPRLLLARRVTADTEAEWDYMAAAIGDQEARETFMASEFISDASAFKAANPGAELEDFLAWRVGFGLDDGLLLASDGSRFPEGWEARAWARASPRPASEQRPLFDSNLEAEKTLHGLESADCQKFFTELILVYAGVVLDELRRLLGNVAVSSTNHLGSQGVVGCAIGELLAALEASAVAAFCAPPLSQQSDEDAAFDTFLAMTAAIENVLELLAALQPKLRLLGLDVGQDGPLADIAKEAAAALLASFVGRIVDNSAAPPLDERLVRSLGTNGELECFLAPVRALWLPGITAPVREYVLASADCADGSLSLRPPDEYSCGHESGYKPPSARLYVEVGVAHVRLASALSRWFE